MVEVYFRDAQKYLEALKDEGVRNLFFYKFDTDENIGEKILGTYGSFSGLSVVMSGEGRKFFEKDGEKCPIYKFTDSIKSFKELAENNEYIFVIGLPPYYPKNRGKIREKIESLNKVQGDAKIHIVGSSSIALMLENKIDAMDVNPLKFANTGILVLPNGRQIVKDNFSEEKKWIRLVGYTLTDLHSKEDYVRFNIKSFLMAGRGEINMFDSPKFPALRESSGTPPKQSKTEMKKNLTLAREKGKQIREYRRAQIFCDVCINKCDMFSEGAICVKNSEFKSLATIFNTRDSELMTEALVCVLASQAERYQEFRIKEKASKTLMPELTKIEASLLKNGIEMLKVLNPTLRPVSNKLIMENPNILAAIMVKQIDEAGIERGKIDPADVLRAITDGSDSVSQETS